MVLVLGVNQGCSEGVGPFELNLNVPSFTKPFEFVCSVRDVRNKIGGPVHVVTVLVVVGVAGVVAIGVGCLIGMFEFLFLLV